MRSGEEVTANQGELLLIDFREGNFVEVNSGASFTYEDKKDETIFEILKGSMRFLFDSAKIDRWFDAITPENSQR